LGWSISMPLVIGSVQLPEARPMEMRRFPLKISPRRVPEVMHGSGNSAVL
jgi:hypothetical protein